ncbi:MULTISPECIES: hypothetical protein [Okeania]|uniref:Uncharacterized protein n=1 Tax=Okeania hirsuta TaxID=1458930 RepID=A0A3N6RWZ0_9CYAN|nr:MULTISPECIES: hypothetical protein [Okeania]NET13074.1 hypothetical protein [Okeania sp. SIO1H6]NEP85878.1 hypothetical protein [Okeania sp. SIO2C2]NES78162.1 hypothetical protein [Okeania sp. SIO1H4]NES93092.1 hypothetical protein [Okeania sp. SIO2B9]NET21837.1 hypothetical protein [Okeania sp. SIO1H5]
MDTKKLVLGGVSLVLGSAIVATAASVELSVEQEQVICKLKETVEQQERAGKKLVFWPLIGKVKERVEVPFTAKLSSNTSYSILGVCDDNCNDLNLTLKNQKGEKIANDKKQDGIPVISFTPTENSNYRITARPDKCSTEKCEFGMVLFVPKSVDLDVASELPDELYLFKLCQE